MKKEKNETNPEDLTEVAGKVLTEEERKDAMSAPQADGISAQSTQTDARQRDAVEYVDGGVLGDHGFQGGERPAGEPIPKTDRGDLDPEVVEYRRKKWTPEQFNEVYPARRLKAAGLPL